MPTRAEWQQALCGSYRLNIESSPSLCNEVWMRQQDRDRERGNRGRQPLSSKETMIPWPSAGRLERVDVRPIDLLHALGKITTPPITELIDLASTWAEIRYIWAFRPNLETFRPRSLRLSDAVAQLDFHQKTLLSDEFGVGFAAWYMARFEGATDPVDAFIAKRNRQVRVFGATRRSLPDYIFKGPNLNQYFVVECKGTQSGRSAAIGQLQRGAEQVVTVELDPPALVTRLVIGACLNPTISLLVIDPDEESERRILSRWSPEELSVFGAAKKLTYIGDYETAARLLHNLAETIEPIKYETRAQAMRQTEHGAFRGSQETHRTPDGRELQMFRGIRVEAPILSSAVEGAGSPDHPFILETESEQEEALVRSISPEGTMFEVVIR
jgi:hypothetical protein